MLAIIILYFLTRGALLTIQINKIGEHTPAFYDIEIARLKRIISEYSTQIPNARAQYQYNTSLLELCKKYNSSQKSIDRLTNEINKSVAIFNAQQNEIKSARTDMQNIKRTAQTSRASTVTDFAYEMAYKNPVARIPAMVSFLAKHMTRTK